MKATQEQVRQAILFIAKMGGKEGIHLGLKK